MEGFQFILVKRVRDVDDLFGFGGKACQRGFRYI